MLEDMDRAPNKLPVKKMHHFINAGMAWASNQADGGPV
jgi:hypothetical protein